MESILENLITNFKNYVQNFDFSNDMISRKFYHTLRVTDYAKDIAKSNNLNDHDYILAFTCALLHDIGRFKQATIYKTYKDLQSIDHGNLGYEILLENDYISQYVTNDIDKQIVLKAVKNHNKLTIDSSLNDRELFFTKLTRDADKLDILDKQKNEVSDGINTIDPKAINLVKEHKLFVRDKKMRNDATEIIHCLTFIFDINFKRTFEIIIEKQLITKKLNILKQYCDNNLVNSLEEELKSYVKKSIANY